MVNFQRDNSISNSHVGRDFENIAREVFKSKGIFLSQKHKLLIGIDKKKKSHEFDLGCDEQKIIVECKSHKWTAGNNIPSAKLTVWNEAMYYFAISPKEYRKIFFALKDARSSNNETLAEYYIRRYSHLIPSDVEIWECETRSQKIRVLI